MIVHLESPARRFIRRTVLRAQMNMILFEVMPGRIKIALLILWSVTIMCLGALAWAAVLLTVWL